MGADRTGGRRPHALGDRDPDAARRPLTVYFDTSAFVKLLIPEPGSDLAHDLWAQADAVASSRILYPEARAAAAAAQRAGRVRARRARSTVKRIEKLHGALRVISLDDALARHAGDLAERHALHGYDAVHLASALAMDVPGDLLIATWDADLAAAAVAEGRMVVPAQP